MSRTIVVDPSEHTRIGALQYGETLPLNDKEVVLTFDDGPLPPHTEHVLETLAAECVKATFFMVGRMANNYPAMVRRVHDEGHTIANHSQNHPFSFARMSVDQAAVEIQGGFASLRAALGDPDAVAPFFRIPGLLRQSSVEQYLAVHDIMTWSLDVVADDWTHIGPEEIARRAISRLESRGKGILLLHDIHKKTALALPIILKELKARGFKIVHVVPASPERPRTETSPEQWVARITREQKLWPRVVDLGVPEAEAGLPAPGPANFGVEYPAGRDVEMSLVRSFDRPPLRQGEVPLPPVPLWPRPTFAAPRAAGVLPVPDQVNFQYVGIFPGAELGGAEGRRHLASAKPHPANAARHAVRSNGAHGSSKPFPFGHQL